MTDTQTMRAEFERIASETPGCKDLDMRNSRAQPNSYMDSDTEAAWLMFQAAWTRKPAAQVAGVVIDLNELSIKSIHDTYVEVFGPLPEELMMNNILYHVEELIRAAHPAPEPDATKVVSVPVPWPWEDRHFQGDDEKIAMAVEIAEWRALAADRERT